VAYKIVYSLDAEDHLKALSARNRRLILDRIDMELAHQPGVPTRNRKRLRPNVLVSWELRVGDLRVYYDIHELPTPQVHILAVGQKVGNRVSVGGKEFQL
jgi:mRNA-degrading endonuclease RelE of RelBE toxin-antitoxin system